MNTQQHVLADISVEPFANGDEHHRLVQAAISAMRADALIVTPGPLSSTVEGPLDDVLAAAGRAHRAGGSHRVLTTLRIESKPGGLHLRDREGAIAATGVS